MSTTDGRSSTYIPEEVVRRARGLLDEPQSIAEYGAAKFPRSHAPGTDCRRLRGVLTACLVLADQRPQVPTPRTEQLRRPIAAAFLNEGTAVCVANQRSGSVWLVDVRQSHVYSELALGGRLTDLAVLPDRKHVLVVEETRHELIALSFDGEKLSVRSNMVLWCSSTVSSCCRDRKRRRCHRSI